MQTKVVTQHTTIKAGGLNKELKPLNITSWKGGKKNTKKGCPPDSYYPTVE